MVFILIKNLLTCKKYVKYMYYIHKSYSKYSLWLSTNIKIENVP